MAKNSSKHKKKSNNKSYKKIAFIIAFIFVHIVEVRLSVLLLMVALRMIYWKKPMTRECALL